VSVASLPASFEVQGIALDICVALLSLPGAASTQACASVALARLASAREGLSEADRRRCFELFGKAQLTTDSIQCLLRGLACDDGTIQELAANALLRVQPSDPMVVDVLRAVFDVILQSCRKGHQLACQERLVDLYATCASENAVTAAANSLFNQLAESEPFRALTARSFESLLLSEHSAGVSATDSRKACFRHFAADMRAVLLSS